MSRSRLLALLLFVPLAVGIAPEPAGAGGGAGGGGGGCHRLLGGAEPTEGNGSTVELGKSCMNPVVLRAEPGATVTFVNRDPMVHNLFGARIAVDLLAAGATTTATYPTAGTYPYACTLHPGMVGTVVVGGGRAATASAEGASGQSPRDEAALDVQLAGTAQSKKGGGIDPLVPAVAGALLVSGATAAWFARRRLAARH